MKYNIFNHIFYSDEHIRLQKGDNDLKLFLTSVIYFIDDIVIDIRLDKCAKGTVN